MRLATSSDRSHLSGTKDSTSGPKTSSFRCATQEFIPTVVFGATSLAANGIKDKGQQHSPLLVDCVLIVPFRPSVLHGPW